MMSSQSNKHDSAEAKSLEGRVWEQLGKNNIKQAISACEQLNRKYPDFASGWHTASHLALKLNNPRVALSAVEKALSIDPNNISWLLQKALCLAQLGRIEAVGLLVDLLPDGDMKTAYHCSTLAMLLTQLGRREQAVRFYEKAAELKPDEAKHYYNIACLQRSLGETEAAEVNFDKTIALDPSDYEAYKIRSELRKQTPSTNHVESLEKLLDQGITDKRGKTNVCYALAKELEDLGEAKRSFHYLKMGADTRRSLMQYDIQRDLDTMESIRANLRCENVRRLHSRRQQFGSDLHPRLATHRHDARRTYPFQPHRCFRGR